MFKVESAIRQPDAIKEITIVTPGAMGTAIGQVLARLNRFNITFGFSSEKSYQHFLQTGESLWLPGIEVDERIKGTTDLPLVLRKADLVILAFPSKYIEEFFPRIKNEINPEADILSVIKGLVPETGMRISESLIAQDPTLRKRFAGLSGPNLARPIAEGLPATTVIASEDEQLAKKLTGFFEGSNIRAYRSTDIIGVELGGAFKNIIAFAAGIGAGMDYGPNAVSALITRSINEIAGLTVLEGGSERTITMGNAGIGDLVVSCTPPGSRNYQAGVRYGKFIIGAEGGEDLESIIESGKTLEGLTAASAADKLLDKYEADYPVIRAAIDVIKNGLNPKKAYKILMEREFVSEEPVPVVDRRIIKWFNWMLHVWNRRYFSPMQAVKSLWKRYRHPISARGV